MAGETLDQETLENMALDIARLLCGRLQNQAIEVSLHTESAAMKSRTVVQVFASTPQGHGMFNINLALGNH